MKTWIISVITCLILLIITIVISIIIIFTRKRNVNRDKDLKTELVKEDKSKIPIFLTLKNEIPIYVTLTTVPQRIISDVFRKNMIAILDQNITQMVMNIPYVYKRTGEQYTIPTWITSHHKIHVNRCEDVGPATKLLASIDIIPLNSIVIVLDDDILYQDFCVQGIVNKLYKNPNTVVVWTFGTWPAWLNPPVTNKPLLTPEGFTAYGAFSNTFKYLFKNQSIPEECKFIDDNWFGWIIHTHNIKIIPVEIPVVWAKSTIQLKHPQEWYELHINTDRDEILIKCGQVLLPQTKLLSDQLQKNIL